MTKIKNQTAYPIKENPVPEDIVIGSNSELDGQTRNFTVGDLADSVAEIISEDTEGIVQDNIIRSKSFHYTGTGSYLEFVDAVNNMAPFEIGEQDIFIFHATSLVENLNMPNEYKFVIKNIGKGTYGVGGTSIGASSIEVIYAGEITYEAVQDFDSTHIVDLGEIGATPVEDVFNASNPSIDVQPQADGYTIVTATVDGEEVNYLFVGPGGLYGELGLFTDQTYFQLLAGQPVSQDNIILVRRDKIDGPTVLTDDVVDSINQSGPFVVGEVNNIIFTFLVDINQRIYSYKYALVNAGKGTYGLNSTQIDAGNIELIYAGVAQEDEITAFPNTVFVDLGNIGSVTVWDHINAEGPYDFQGQQDGYTIVTATIDGTEYSYLFVGAEGTYGAGELESFDTDFQLLTGFQAPPAPTPSELEKIAEFGKVGHRILGKNPANYGGIGQNAVDLSHSNSLSSTYGATGPNAFATGVNTTASGPCSVAFGSYTIASSGGAIAMGGYAVASGSSAAAFNLFTTASGGNSFSTGQLNTSFAVNSFTGGGYNEARTYSEAVLGHYATIINGNTTGITGSDPVFRVGNGTATGLRSDALKVLKSGEVIAPDLTNAKILAATGKVLVTKDYLATIGGSTPDLTAVLTEGNDATGKNMTIDAVSFSGATNTIVGFNNAGWEYYKETNAQFSTHNINTHTFSANGGADVVQMGVTDLGDAETDFAPFIRMNFSGNGTFITNSNALYSPVFLKLPSLWAVLDEKTIPVAVKVNGTRFYSDEAGEVDLGVVTGGAVGGATVADIAARDAFNVPDTPFTVFVEDDGDAKWAMYIATSTGVGADFTKISDEDLFTATMNDASVKIAYENNADTNCLTDALLTKLNGIASGATANSSNATLLARANHTGTQLASTISDFSTAVDTVIEKTIKTVSATTYTLLDSDYNKILHFTAATDVTVTIPSGLTKKRFEGKQMGAGQVNFTASGTTLQKDADELLKTKGQYSVFAIDYTASETYCIYGKLELA